MELNYPKEDLIVVKGMGLFLPDLREDCLALHAEVERLTAERDRYKAATAQPETRECHECHLYYGPSGCLENREPGAILEPCDEWAREGPAKEMT